MDESEKALLKRRKQYIAENVELDAEMLNYMHHLGLLAEESVHMLQLEKSNSTRVSRFIEHLVAMKSGVDVFRLFCEALVNSHKWLVRDLQTDLKVERGEVKPPPEILQEAAALVHRRFGTSKRFSETDKKDMAEMIAIKLQIADDEWQAELAKREARLQDERDAEQRRERAAKRIQTNLRKFVQDHEKQLVSQAHDLVTTQDFVRRMLAQDDDGGLSTVKTVAANVDRLLKQMSSALYQRESLYYEREKCLRLLGISDQKMALDKAIGNATGMNIVNSALDVEDKTTTIKRLQTQVSELEGELDLAADDVRQLQRQLDERDREISKLRRMVQID